MGSPKPIITAPIITAAALAVAPLLAIMPVQAQDNSSQGAEPVTPGLQNFSLDPARDRNRTPEREGPEVDNRVPVTPPAQPVPQVTVPTVRMPPAQTPAPASPAPQRVQPLPVAPPSVAPAPVSAAPAPQAAPAQSEPAPVAEPQVANEALPAPQANAVEPPAATPLPESEVAAPASESGVSVAWLIGGGAVSVAALIAAIFLFRRRKTSDARDIETFSEPAPSPSPPPPAPAPLSEPPPPEAIEPDPIQPDRPHPAIAIAFTATAARVTMLGVTIGYSISMTNEGNATAEDIGLSALIDNARSGQEQDLARFFAERPEIPVHAADRLAPGDSLTLSGELRLAQDDIVPIPVGERSLLIPVVGFSAHYRWDAGDPGEAQGYSGAAFIVGQENDPPTERMAPFRLDQGPKQFRSVGSRLARTALVR